jgi:hypothetical protein
VNTQNLVPACGSARPASGKRWRTRPNPGRVRVQYEARGELIRGTVIFRGRETSFEVDPRVADSPEAAVIVAVMAIVGIKAQRHSLTYRPVRRARAVKRQVWRARGRARRSAVGRRTTGSRDGGGDGGDDAPGEADPPSRLSAPAGPSCALEVVR